MRHACCRRYARRRSVHRRLGPLTAGIHRQCFRRWPKWLGNGTELLDQSALPGNRSRIGTVGHPKLLEDSAQMHFHGILRDLGLNADLLIPQILANQTENLEFLRGHGTQRQTIKGPDDRFGRRCGRRERFHL